MSGDQPDWSRACCQEQVYESLAAAALPHLAPCVGGVCSEWEAQLRTAQEERMAALRQQMEAQSQKQAAEAEHRRQVDDLRQTAEEDRDKLAAAERASAQAAAAQTAQLDQLEQTHAETCAAAAEASHERDRRAA